MFEQFVLRHGPELVAFARRLVMDHQRGEDVVQEALARCSTRWRRVAADNPRAYAYRAVVNEAISWRRRSSPVEFATVELCDESGQSTSAAREHADFTSVIDRRDEVAHALRQLSIKQRTVLVLRYYNGLPDDEISIVTGWPPNTVRSHAHRGLRRLEQIMIAAGARAGTR